MPQWAQGPTQKFIDHAKIDGTQTSPMDQDSFQQSFNQATGVILLTGSDEVAGEDQAMDEPGVVRRNGATIYFDGDPCDSKGNVEAVVLGRRKGIEYVTYVQSHPNGFSTLRMVNDDGSIEVSGSEAQRKGGKLQGYLLSGQIYA